MSENWVALRSVGVRPADPSPGQLGRVLCENGNVLLVKFLATQVIEGPANRAPGWIDYYRLDGVVRARA